MTEAVPPSTPGWCFLPSSNISFVRRGNPPGFPWIDLVDALQPHVPHIGKGDVYRLLAGEKLNRKTYLTSDEKSSKPKRFKSEPTGYLHTDIKHLPKLGGECGLLFVAIDRNTRLTTIHMYPKAGIREAAALLDRCARFFAFPISYVLTDNGACFTDRFASRRGRPSGNHLFDKACNQHGIEHRLTKAYHPQTNGMVERFNRRVSEVLKPIRFKDYKTMMETLHGYLNHYNRNQGQPALGGLSPLDCWRQWKHEAAKRRGESTKGAADGDPQSHGVKPAHPPPDPTIREPDPGKAQENAITACHAQLKHDSMYNQPYGYTIFNPEDQLMQ